MRMTLQTTAIVVTTWRRESQNQKRVKNFWLRMLRGRTQRAEMSLAEPPVPVLKIDQRREIRVCLF